MSKAETMECVDCSGRGFRGVQGGLCPTCNGTGIVTTGEFLGTLPSTREPVTEDDGYIDPDEIFIHPVPPKSVSRSFVAAERVDELEATIAEQAAEIEKLKQSCTGFLRSIASQETDINHRDARINEQAAEIERLRERVSGLEQLHASWADGSLAELTAERDALRAAVDHLKGERDTLRGALEIAAARSDSQNASISYFEQESASHNAALAEATTERDVLRLEGMRHREKAEKYAAVIAAQSDMIEAQERHNEISLRLSQAYSVAGFATDVLQVGDVPRVKEADNG